MDLLEMRARMDAIAARGAEMTPAEITEYETLETRAAVLERHDTAVNGGIPTGGAPTNREAADLGEEQYRAAFTAYLRTGQINADLIQSRAQHEGSGTTGGYLVPDEWRNKLVDRMVDFGGLAAVVETITTGDGRPLNWPTVADDSANMGEIVQEGNSFVSGADLVFGTAALSSYSYASGGAGGQALRVSYELAQDAAFDIAGLVRNKLGDRIARIQAIHVVRGTGVDQPLGIITGRTGIEPPAASVTYAALLKFIHSIDPAYRSRARWAFNDQSLAVIRGMVDNNGRPIVKAGNDSIAGDPGGMSLLGYPVTIDQAFPNMSLADDGVNWGVFGDLKEGYVIRRVRQVEILVNPYSRMNNREIEYSAWARMDATQQDTNAYVALTGFEA